MTNQPPRNASRIVGLFELNDHSLWVFLTKEVHMRGDTAISPHVIAFMYSSSLCFQVMCFRTKCYPRWGVPFESIDWRNEAHAVHWTWPTPTEFMNQETLVNATGTWAEIGQNVLRQAGLLDAKAESDGR